LKKLMLLAAVVAMLAVAAIPAIGQVSNEVGQETESGDIEVAFEVSSEGNYAQQCAAPLQFGNTGNVQNAQGFLQYGSTSDDIEAEGSVFAFEPEIETVCDQAVQQSSAASS